MQRSFVAKLTISMLLTVAAAGRCAATEADPWKPFNLESTKVAGVTVHYEKALEGRVAGVTAGLAAGWNSIEIWKRKAEELETNPALADDAEKIIGGTADENLKALLETGFGGAIKDLPWLAGLPTHVYLVRDDTIKEYLKAGGSLPHFAYDREANMATYIRTPGERDSTVFVPVKTYGTSAVDMSAAMSQLDPEKSLFSAFYSVIEAAALQRIKPADMHLRWFSEGVTEVISERLAAKYISKAAADGAAADKSTAPYMDMRQDINLQYWLFRSFETETPLEAEWRLACARSAFARFEANRLIEAHGVECVKAILDRLPAAGTSPATLLAAISAATGEDMEGRLKGYQRFEDQSKGSALYVKRCEDAVAAHDLPTALAALLRQAEISSDYNVDVRYRAARGLALLGYDDYGTRMFIFQTAMLKKRGLTALLHGTQIAFIKYALRSERRSAAYATAEEVLAALPDYAPALAVRLSRLVEAQQRDEALAVAKRIVALDNDPESDARVLAQKAIDSFGGAAGNATPAAESSAAK